MPLLTGLRTIFLVSGFFISTAANAQSPVEEIGPLPTTLSMEQLQLLQGLSGSPVTEAAQPHARRRLPRPALVLSPEEASYKLAVQKLGVDKHRYVHCDLPHGRVRTGVITEVREQGFMLKDGIIYGQWIRYTDLKAPPRQVPAIGTHIVHGLKWGGVVVGAVAVIPLIPLFAIALHSD